MIRIMDKYVNKSPIMSNFYLMIILLTLSILINYSNELLSQSDGRNICIFPSSRNELVARMPSNSICAEIGVDSGDFSQRILDFAKPQKLYLVDCWENQSNNIYSDTHNVSNNEYEMVYEYVKNRFKDDMRISILRAFSAKAVQYFQDNFFDWIYIDANHSYDAVIEDLKLWFPKVKHGGIIAGHDYVPWCGVVQAVSEFLKNNNLELLYLTSEKGTFENPSFAFVKP